MQLVYIVKAGKYYKIGITTDLSARFRNLQTGNPEQLKLFELWTAPNRKIARQVEKELHSQLRGFKKKGEWFEVTDTYMKTTLFHVFHRLNSLRQWRLKKVDERRL